MPKGTEINPDTIDAVISHAGDTGYGAIAARGKWYADKIEAVKSLRNLASKYYKQSAANYSVDAESKADMLRSEADAMDKFKATGGSIVAMKDLQNFITRSPDMIQIWVDKSTKDGLGDKIKDLIPLQRKAAQSFANSRN